jgi:hypothetical protein
MARNRKLTSVIAGRTLVRVDSAGSIAHLTFDDGSVLTAQLAGPQELRPVRGKVRAVRQTGTRLQLDLIDGQTLELTTAEPASSVILRAKDGTLEYAD